MNEEEQFHSEELQKKFEFAKEVSDEHLKRLNRMSVDIKRLEHFFQQSGFGFFKKTYHMSMYWDTKRLCYGEKPLIETAIEFRNEGYNLLPDFLEQISMYHLKMGAKNEDN